MPRVIDDNGLSAKRTDSRSSRLYIRKRTRTLPAMQIDSNLESVI
jgi:hypothetical protein